MKILMYINVTIISNMNKSLHKIISTFEYTFLYVNHTTDDVVSYMYRWYNWKFF